MKEQLILLVQARNLFHHFSIWEEKKYMEEWRRDGLGIREVGEFERETPKKTQKPCSISVRGLRKEWAFDTYLDPAELEYYRNAGVHIDPVVNTIPKWWIDLGLPVGVWCFLQDHQIVGI